LWVLLFFSTLRFYLFIYLSERERAQAGERQVEGEAGSLLSRGPDVGLDGNHDLSWKQTFNRLSHPGIPILFNFKNGFTSSSIYQNSNLYVCTSELLKP